MAVRSTSSPTNSTTAPVLGQAEVPILPGDTPDTLAARVLVEEHRLYPRVLAELVRTM